MDLFTVSLSQLLCLSQPISRDWPTVFKGQGSKCSVLIGDMLSAPTTELCYCTVEAPMLLLLLLLSCFSRVRLCATPETAAHQALPSLGFSRQEHWSGLPFPSPTPIASPSYFPGYLNHSYSILTFNCKLFLNSQSRFHR